MRRVFEFGSVILVGALAFGFWQSRGKTHEGFTPDTNIVDTTPYTAAQIDFALNAIGAPNLVGLGAAFKRAESNYKIHALFITAMAVHESDKGRSRIAREKNNLFGWGAYDATPYDSAFTFSSKENGILHVASRLKALYVDQWGLNTPKQIGERYASDSEWAEKVSNWARRIEDEIRN